MEKEMVNIIQIPMPKDELLHVQKAATAQHKLVPDFIADAIRAVTRDCMDMEQERRGQENRRAHRHGVAEGKADAAQAAYSLLRDHGHNEAADLLGIHFTTVGNATKAAPMERTEIVAETAEIAERF